MAESHTDSYQFLPILTDFYGFIPIDTPHYIIGNPFSFFWERNVNMVKFFTTNV